MSADLYFDRIDFQKYIDPTDCIQCGYPSCGEFLDAVRNGIREIQECSFIGRNKAYAFEAIKKIEESWPEVPLLLHPRTGFTGLVELNEPDAGSLILISGNNEYTEQVLMTVLGTTLCPFFVVFSDTGGNTVDMSMIYQTMTAESICKTVRESGIEKKVSIKEILIPGLASSLREDIEKLTGWQVRVGPVCAAELPLFLSEIWIPPKTGER
jgi:CO dehydrogenase/acetyl-CoA synthase gamma subunit (corrinoid Fe-S protein)